LIYCCSISMFLALDEEIFVAIVLVPVLVFMVNQFLYLQLSYFDEVILFNLFMLNFFNFYLNLLFSFLRLSLQINFTFFFDQVLNLMLFNDSFLLLDIKETWLVSLFILP
jgi:hypothetical protein